VFGPYGTVSYHAGTLNTAKGFVGQYSDQLTGLDYFNARYYDPVAGVFLSADKVQGNVQGMDPYGYVDGNPETRSDPTGQMIEGQNGEYGTIDSQGNLHIWVPYPSYGSGQGYIYRTYFYTHAQLQQPAQDTSRPSSWQKLMDALGITDIQNTFNDPNASWWDKLGAIGGALFNDANNLLLAAMILGDPEGDAILGGGEALAEEGGALAEKSEVLLDTSAVYHYKDLITKGLLNTTEEEPVITETTMSELLNNALRGKPKFTHAATFKQLKFNWHAEGSGPVGLQ